jgi:hypothetical protein
MLYTPLALPQAQHIANGAYIQPLNQNIIEIMVPLPGAESQVMFPL